MKTKTDRIGWGFLTARLAAWVGLCCVVSCSSSDQVPAGGRVEHPDPTPAPTPTTTNVAASPAPTPETSAPPEAEEQSPKTLEDEPARPLSKNVPKRSCKKDGECGDGFCDRGRCAAIWSYTWLYGQPCEENRYRLPCIDGRYRSCVSDAECTWAHHRTDNMNPKCVPDTYVPGGRECVGGVASVLPPMRPSP
jgi:hypothetical protein